MWWSRFGFHPWTSLFFQPITPNVPAYWRGGYFGIDTPQTAKLMRSAQLLTDQFGFRVKCHLVDHESSTFRNPRVVDFKKVDLAYLSVNEKARLACFEIQWPEEDCDANVLELSNSWFALSER